MELGGEYQGQLTSGSEKGKRVSFHAGSWERLLHDKLVNLRYFNLGGQSLRNAELNTLLIGIE